jgi:hypothetical protein
MLVEHIRMSVEFIILKGIKTRGTRKISKEDSSGCKQGV